MKKKLKGFTLIEILAVIAIIGVISLLIAPIAINVINRANENAYNMQKKQMIEATKMYVTDRHATVFKNMEGLFYLSLQELTDAGYISTPIKNPITKTDFLSDQTVIKIEKKTNGLYNYEVVYGEVTLEKDWNYNFGGTLSEYFSAVTTTKDGGYVATGRSPSTNGDLIDQNKGDHDAIIVKFNELGGVVWKRNFGGSNIDEFNDVLESADGGYIAVGSSSSNNFDLENHNNGSSDAIIVKYNANGVVVWKRNFGGSSTDGFKSIAQAKDGGYIAVGSSQSTNGPINNNKGGNDAIIVKFDINGNVLWNENYGGSSSDEFSSVVATRDNGYIAVGRSQSTNGDLLNLNKGGNDAIIVKYNANGGVIWKNNFGGSSSDFFKAVIETKDNSILAVGWTSSNDGDLINMLKGFSDALIVKYDANGNVLWRDTFGGSFYQDFYDLIENHKGNYIVVGYTSSSDGPFEGLAKGNDDAILVEFDVAGNVLWNKNFGGTNWDYFQGIVQNKSGDYFMVGTSASNNDDLFNLNKGLNDAIIAKYNYTFTPL